MGKIKDAAWWLIVGNENLNEVYYVKRVYFKKRITRDFQQVLPNKDKNLTVWLISDSYIGIDQVNFISINLYYTIFVQFFMISFLYTIKIFFKIIFFMKLKLTFLFFEIFEKKT